MAGKPQRPSVSRKQRAQTDPAAQTLDKLGLMLTILVMLSAVIVIFFVESPRGIYEANTGFFGTRAPDASKYDTAASDMKILAIYQSGRIAAEQGKVDSATISGGHDKGIYIGDRLTVSTEAKEGTVYMIVREVRATECDADIFHSLPAADPDVKKSEVDRIIEANMHHEMLYSRKLLGNLITKAVSRSWSDQIVRKAVHEIR